MNRLRPNRWWFAAVALLVASSFVLPLWRTRMEAPQYHDDEALLVSVYAAKVIGDLKEIETLNQYVGVRLPLDGAEIQLLPYVFAALAALAAAAALLPTRMRRRAAQALLGLLLTVGVGGLSVLQFRLYEMGHDRGDQILEGVKDFTPPVIGHIKAANFDAWTSFGAGGWLLALAVVMVAVMVIVGESQASTGEPVKPTGKPVEQRVGNPAIGQEGLR